MFCRQHPWITGLLFFFIYLQSFKNTKERKKGNAHIKGSPAPSLRQVPTNQPTESLLKRDFFFFPQRSTTEGTCPTLSAPGPTLVGRVRCRPTSRAFQSSPDLILKAWQLCRISQQLCWKDCGGTIYLAGTQLPKHYTTLLTKHLDDKRFAWEKKKNWEKKKKKVGDVNHIRWLRRLFTAEGQTDVVFCPAELGGRTGAPPWTATIRELRPKSPVCLVMGNNVLFKTGLCEKIKVFISYINSACVLTERYNWIAFNVNGWTQCDALSALGLVTRQLTALEATNRSALSRI